MQIFTTDIFRIPISYYKPISSTSQTYHPYHESHKNQTQDSALFIYTPQSLARPPILQFCRLDARVIP